MDGFDTRQLDDLSRAMLNTAQKVYPREVKKFMRREGTKAGKVLRAEIKATTHKRTGKLQKGVKRGKVWKDGDGTWHVRAYDRAPHNIPINQGHFTKDGKKFLPAAGFFQNANATVSREIVSDVEAFIDDMLQEGFVL